MIGDEKPYLEIIKERSKKSRVYKEHQLIGLTIAGLLGDEKHKSLYIKLARDRNGQKLLALAADIAQRKNVKNKGAYFMRLLSHEARKNFGTNGRYRRKTFSGRN